MKITTSKEALFLFTDELLARWRSTPKRYPFNRPSAVIPQILIPDELRKDKVALSNFYVAVDNDMKGKVTSITAFKGYIGIWEKYPWFFDPTRLLWEKPQRIVEIYEEFLPIDKIAKTKALFINYRHLMQYYESSAFNLLKGCDSYEEALRRILNKRTKKELAAAGYAGEGLFNHRHKMVSMQVYFQDWERWLKPRFIYPPPGDIQNFRVGVACGALIVHFEPGEEHVIYNYELIAAPWREITTEYIRARKEDPQDVADVYWLFGAETCGNSPLTVSKRKKKPKKDGDKHDVPKAEQLKIFDASEAPEVTDIRRYLQPKHRKGLEETCLICPALGTCNYAIPAGPYYDEGELVLKPRPRVEDFIDRVLLREPEYPVPDEMALLPFDPSD